MKSTKEGSYNDTLSDLRVRIDGLNHENIKLRSEVKCVRKELSRGFVVLDPSSRVVLAPPFTLDSIASHNAPIRVVDHYNKFEGKYNKSER